MFKNLVVLLSIVLIFGECLGDAPSIIIVGAGPSGIAAATRLLKNNFTNIVILEAEGRIGGRIRSEVFGDAYIDLGAEWCHGEENNIVYDMIKDYNVLRHTNLTYRLVHSDGKYVGDSVYGSLIRFAENIDASQVDPVTEEYCKDISSIGECFDTLFNTTFTARYQNDTRNLQIISDSTDWLRCYMMAYDSTFTLNDLSRRSAYKRCKGDLRLNWDGKGYKTILDVMMQKFPEPDKQLPIEDVLLVNKEVTRISWQPNGTSISIHCSDNTSYQADHVIFTPSLGVLKAQHASLFQPSLPDDKIVAIRNFGFGAVFKISMLFPVTWWNASELLGFVWSLEDQSRILDEFPFGPVKNGRSWLTYSVKFFQAENNPRVIMGFFAGDVVPDLERESDDVIIRGVTYMFQKFLGHKFSVIQPEQLRRSSWYSNPHFRGTYSYESVCGNSTGRKYPEKLAQPLRFLNGNPSVLFAGEATHPYYFSTVHAAIETGYREADRLISLYKT